MEFSCLIVKILKHLEPRALQEEEIIFYEGKEIGEALFFLNGRVEVGYVKQQVFKNNPNNLALEKL